MRKLIIKQLFLFFIIFFFTIPIFAAGDSPTSPPSNIQHSGHVRPLTSTNPNLFYQEGLIYTDISTPGGFEGVRLYTYPTQLGYYSLSGRFNVLRQITVPNGHYVVSASLIFFNSGTTGARVWVSDRPFFERLGYGGGAGTIGVYIPPNIPYVLEFTGTAFVRGGIIETPTVYANSDNVYILLESKFKIQQLSHKTY